MANYEGELICDFTQYYHIIDFKGLSPLLVATLLIGLPDDSRVKMAISGAKISVQNMLLARMADDIAFLAWAQTKDGQKNKNRPKSILKMLLQEDDAEKCESFSTADDFEKRWKEITGG